MQTVKQVAWAAFLFACVFWAGLWVGEARQKIQCQDAVRRQEQAAFLMQQRLDGDIANMALKHEEALIYEQQIIDDLRLGLRAGTVRLRQAQAQCDAVADQRAHVGDGERAESADSEPGLGQAVLDLAEHAKTAIAQRDALQAIIRKVNHENALF